VTARQGGAKNPTAVVQISLRGRLGLLETDEGSKGDHRVPVRENVGMTTFPESHRDLLDGQVASLATLGGDGFPQLTEVWFLFDDDGEIKLSLNTSRLKTRNLRTRPQCSLLLLDLENPYRYLEVRGRARIEPDEDYSFARKLGAKYDADLSVHDRPGEGRVAITIEPANVYAVDMSGG
jgi:PPOX class probable F420-dependent enzyme